MATTVTAESAVNMVSQTATMKRGELFCLQVTT